MNGNQLIAALQKLTPEQRELPVFIRHPAQCCCGDCFCPGDDYSDGDVPDVMEIKIESWPEAKYQAGIVL